MSARPEDDAGCWFGAAWYLTRNPDIARAGLDPWAHYLAYGEPEGRKPSPWFDPAWYRGAHGLAPGESPLRHFLAHRATGAFPPDPALFAAAHLPEGRAAIARGQDPYAAYLDAHATPEHELLPDLVVLAPSGLIDALYHERNRTPPVETVLDPALHYCRIGWRQDRLPSDAFDPGWYRRAYPEIARLRINPLTHYALVGDAAGRRPVPWFDPGWYRAAHDVPADMTALAHYLRHRRSGLVSPNALFDAGWYRARHAIAEGVDPFAHYLHHGAVRDIDPSPRFDARLWRHRHMAPLTAPGLHDLPIERRNPLLHHLRYMAGLTLGARQSGPGPA